MEQVIIRWFFFRTRTGLDGLKRKGQASFNPRNPGGGGGDSPPPPINNAFRAVFGQFFFTILSYFGQVVVKWHLCGLNIPFMSFTAQVWGHVSMAADYNAYCCRPWWPCTASWTPSSTPGSMPPSGSQSLLHGSLGKVFIVVHSIKIAKQSQWNIHWKFTIWGI